MANHYTLDAPQYFDEVNINKLFAEEIYVSRLSALSANFLNIVLEVLKLSAIDLIQLSSVYLTAANGNIFDLNTWDLSAGKIWVDSQLSAQEIQVDSLTSIDLYTTDLYADVIKTNTLDLDSLALKELSAQTSIFDNISAKFIAVEVLSAFNLDLADLPLTLLSAQNAIIDNLSSVNATITALDVVDAFIENLSTTKITSVSGDFSLFDVTGQYLSAGEDLLEVIDRPLANVLYVNMSGSDINSGRNPHRALKTIKKACEIAHNDLVLNNNNPRKRYTVFVSTGDFYEDNPVYVPPNVSIIGDNLRRSNIRPVHRQNDIFWVDNSTYVWGFTFRDHFSPCATAAYPNLDIESLSGRGFRNLIEPSSGWKRPFIVTSPYIQGCSSITVGVSSTLQNVEPQKFDLALTNGVEASAAVARCFDDVVNVVLYGPLSGNIGTTLNTTGSVAASGLLHLNDTYIQKEVLAFVNRYWPGLLTTPTLIDQYENGISYILSAVQFDIVNGSNSESIRNGQGYWNGTTPVLPPDQIIPTVQAIEHAKYLATWVIQNSATQTLEAGMGMRVDGSKAEGFLRSMVLDSFTQFNQNGKGIYITNNGYAQLVSIFTICCNEGITVEDGGWCSISNSNCSFGLSGIVARGKSTSPILTGALAGFQQFVEEETPFQTRNLAVSGVNGTFIFPDSKNFVPGSPIDSRKIAYTPYNGLVFTFPNNPALSGDLFTIRNNPTLSATGDKFVFETTQRLNINEIQEGELMHFFLRSTAYASSHTFEFIGTGVDLVKAVPALGAVPSIEDEVVTDGVGEVYYTSTNHTGDFSVGEEFRIVSSTGTIEGRTFQRAILTLVTPLTLALE